MKRLIIDTDTASDDAVALLLALRHPATRVEAITVVAGNVPLAQAVTNALVTVDVAETYQPPVYIGASGPLAGDLRTAESVHGANGMGDIPLPDPSGKAAEREAPEAIVAAARAAPGEFTLVTLGPLTNVALALELEPRLGSLLKELYVMGGTSDHLGNITPSAEFNIWVDPVAARRVFHAGCRLTMVGWDISRKYAVIDDPTAERLRALGTRQALFAMDINRSLREFCRDYTHIDGIDMPDPVTVAVAIEPKILTRSVERYVDVETEGEITRGATIVDYLSVLRKEPNARVCLETDAERFLTLVFDLLGG